MPAQATAKSVIASAKRLIEFRHDCRNNNKIAEIKRASVADSNPPYEVDDGEAPTDWDVDAPNADALGEKIRRT